MNFTIPTYTASVECNKCGVAAVCESNKPHTAGGFVKWARSIGWAVTRMPNFAGYVLRYRCPICRVDNWRSRR